MAPASTRELERTLPRKAPNTDRHRTVLNRPGQYKYVIYSIAPLDTRALQQLESDVNNAELSNGDAKLAPQPDFSNRSLRDVYDYHIQIRDEDETVHPLYFIVADQLNSKDSGVLVVHLDRGGDENAIGVGRTGVDMAETYGVNIDIGNQDWLDLKEEEENEWGGEDPYADDDQDSHGGAASTTAQSGAAGTSSPTKYGWYSLVQKAVPISSMLEPGYLKMKPNESRFQMLGNYSSLSDPWKQIRSSHPQQCTLRPEIHRTLVLVASHEDANHAEGTSIVHLKWDGDVSALDEETGSEVMPETELLRKVPASEALRTLDEASQAL